VKDGEFVGALLAATDYVVKLVTTEEYYDYMIMCNRLYTCGKLDGKIINSTKALYECFLIFSLISTML